MTKAEEALARVVRAFGAMTFVVEEIDTSERNLTGRGEPRLGRDRVRATATGRLEDALELGDAIDAARKLVER